MNFFMIRYGRALLMAVAATVYLAGCGSGGGKPSKNDAVNAESTAVAQSEQTKNTEKSLRVDTVKVKPKSTPCPADEDYSNGGSSDLSGEYPKISGLTDTGFQEKVNADIKNQVDEFLSESDDYMNAEVSFKIFQNDGEIFAAQLHVLYEPSCAGGNNWMTDDKMITIDVPNNKMTVPRFSTGGNPLYPNSEVTMSVASINKIIAEYESKDSDCNKSISDIKDGTFVVNDGYVAIEMFLGLGCAIDHASVAIHAIPLYKAPPVKSGSAKK
jgi:hypothetical protein